MSKYLYIIVFLFLTGNYSLSGQSAPDFTVTDSWGITHHLYQDYLDKDKTVVLKIFYVACPPCNSIAPFLEPLYQEWGGGHGDVQFIELSIKQSDTNAQVNAYKENHSTTYPAAGGDGNSVAATQPYTNGTFGLYTGTPTFVVIAPDKSVNYDVYGLDIQGTIEALDEAIANTGAEGLPTSTNIIDEDMSVKLISNLASDRLVFEVIHDVNGLEATILNPSGQVVSSIALSIAKGNVAIVDVTDLTPGIWICRIADKDGFAASYLFIKN